jgi:enoyl reductase-like protein
MRHSTTYEKQKQKIIEIAEDKFGKVYFEQLERITKEYLEEENIKEPKLLLNYKGAFYAY